MSEQMPHARTVVEGPALRRESRFAGASAMPPSAGPSVVARLVRDLWRRREPAWRLLIRVLVVVVFGVGIIGTNYKLQGALSLAAYAAALAIIDPLVQG
jgi:hypothetical protein